jgi:hypothetical protein
MGQNPGEIAPIEPLDFTDELGMNVGRWEP